MDAKLIAKTESNYGNNSAIANTRPGQPQYQSVELWPAQTDPLSGTSSRPNEVALVQPPGGQPDADTVMHQYLHAVGAPVGKEVRGVRMRCAEDLHDSGQGGVGAGPHVHRHRCQPHRIDSDHANHSRSQAAQALLSCNGHFTMTLVLARWTSIRMSGSDAGTGKASLSVTGTNADDWAARADWLCSRSQRCTMLAFIPRFRATAAMEAPAWPHSQIV
jgi:hypothetical protein